MLVFYFLLSLYAVLLCKSPGMRVEAGSVTAVIRFEAVSCVDDVLTYTRLSCFFQSSPRPRPPALACISALMVGSSFRNTWRPGMKTPSQAPRGLSAEEKRVKLLEIFHETVCLTLLLVRTNSVHLDAFYLSALQKDFFQVQPPFNP